MKAVRLDDVINELKSLDNNGCITRSTSHICEDIRNEVKEFDVVSLDQVKELSEEILAYSNVASDLKQKIAFKSCLALIDDFITKNEITYPKSEVGMAWSKDGE